MNYRLRVYQHFQYQLELFPTGPYLSLDLSCDHNNLLDGFYQFALLLVCIYNESQYHFCYLHLLKIDLKDLLR